MYLYLRWLLYVSHGQRQCLPVFAVCIESSFPCCCSHSHLLPLCTCSCLLLSLCIHYCLLALISISPCLHSFLLHCGCSHCLTFILISLCLLASPHVCLIYLHACQHWGSTRISRQWGWKRVLLEGSSVGVEMVCLCGQKAFVGASFNICMADPEFPEFFFVIRWCTALPVRSAGYLRDMICILRKSPLLGTCTSSLQPIHCYYAARPTALIMQDYYPSIFCRGQFRCAMMVEVAVMYPLSSTNLSTDDMHLNDHTSHRAVSATWLWDIEETVLSVSANDAY